MYTNLHTLPGRKFSVMYYVINQAKHTVDLPSNETPEFIPPSLWPPNSPEINPLNYTIWQVAQDRVYKTKIDNVDQIKQRTCIVSVWNEMEQTMIDRAVDQWHKRLEMCNRAHGSYFEHLMSFFSGHFICVR